VLSYHIKGGFLLSLQEDENFDQYFQSCVDCLMVQSRTVSGFFTDVPLSF